MPSIGLSSRNFSSVITASGLPPTTGLTFTSPGVFFGSMVTVGRLATSISVDNGSDTPTPHDRTFGILIRYFCLFLRGSIGIGVSPFADLRDRLRVF